MANEHVVGYQKEAVERARLGGDPIALEMANKGLSRANAVGMVMAVMLIATNAVAAEQEGDPDKAHAIVANGLKDLAEGALIFGGIELAAVAIGAIVGLPLGAAVGGFLAVYGAYEALRMVPTLLSSINTLVTNALNWVAPRRDPLVLDLDGNGITTSGINPNAPILFDQDGDGTKTATGWIASGEAIVVRDLNGNGTIDSGRELFGDNTILTHGARAGQTAANGFEALADLDADANGVADGKFDGHDVAFSSVKLWKDLNQDGVSQANELLSFADLGVASINVAGTGSNVNLGGGNTQTFSGSFTKADGTVGSSGTAHMAGSLLLANNNFYREFTDDPAVSTEAAALPQMTGSGAVRDLRPAMSLGTAQALALQAQLAQFAAGTTKAQ
ncbi:hypothetical protein [Variovorax rhizosphaerae]|uniref:Uncharacterized protein n=1 Tax=Variovorax rhizosphaerae TaxID=1836200 RepID=A0ABU8WQP5_9BURK